MAEQNYFNSYFDEISRRLALVDVSELESCRFMRAT